MNIHISDYFSSHVASFMTMSFWKKQSYKTLLPKSTSKTKKNPQLLLVKKFCKKFISSYKIIKSYITNFFFIHKILKQTFLDDCFQLSKKTTVKTHEVCEHMT